MNDGRHGHRILLIEDDLHISSLLRLHLEKAGFCVSSSFDGESGLTRLAAEHFELVILDLILPGISGHDVCRQLTEMNSRPLIMMLTGLFTPQDRVRGLDMGADDYMGKPFSFEELLARVRALLRRPPLCSVPANASEPHVFVAGELVLDRWDRSVMLADRQISLAAREFELLLFLVRHPGRVFSRADLLDTVWGCEFEGHEHTVNSHINRLRAKLEDDPTRPSILVTVRRGGYMLVPARGTQKIAVG